MPVRAIPAWENPGYAAACNLGVSSTNADQLIFINPDVLVLPGCLTHLLQALETAAVAGPRFYWDSDKRFLLPPTEIHSHRAELRRRLATRGERPAQVARSSWRNHARRHWLAIEPLASYQLSGALLAARRDTFERVGPFDEGFRLYFEETDWLLRLKKQGLSSAYVPRAEAVHLFNQSAQKEPQAEAWFVESQARFEEKHYGRTYSRLLSALASNSPDLTSQASTPLEASSDPPTIQLPPATQESLWLEISPTPLGIPAAAELVAPTSPRSWTLPASVWKHLAPGTYFIRLSKPQGKEAGFYSFVRTAKTPDVHTSVQTQRPTNVVASEWAIRSYQENDEGAILDLFQVAFHQPRSLDSWQWKYRNNPYTNLEISLAFDPAGNLGAHYGSYSCRFYDATGDQPKTILANQIGDTMTSKAARKVGRGRSSLLGQVTRHHFAHFCQDRVGFNYGFNVGKIQRYYLKLVPGSRFFETAPFRVLETDLETVPDQSSSTPSLRVERVEQLDERWDLFFARVAPDYSLLVERDQNYLRWRYLDCPDVDYLIYAIFNADALVGWSVFRRQDGSLFWGDALFDCGFPAAPRQLLARVRALHPAEGKRVEAWFSPRPDWWHQILVAMGFESQPEPQDLGMIYKPFTEPDPMDRFQTHLYYTKGDGDLF